MFGAVSFVCFVCVSCVLGVCYGMPSFKCSVAISVLYYANEAAPQIHSELSA